MATSGPTGVIPGSYVNPVATANTNMPSLLTGGLGSAMLTPEEQMAMLEGQRKVAMTPSEVADTQARSAVNAAQAQMLTKQANKLGMQMPMPYRLPNGQMAYLTPTEVSEMEHRRVSSELDARKVAIDEVLNPLRTDLLRQQVEAAKAGAGLDQRKSEDISRRLEGIRKLQSGELQLPDDPAKAAAIIMSIDPEAGRTYLKSLGDDMLTRKSRSRGDTWTMVYQDSLEMLKDDLKFRTNADKVAEAKRRAYEVVGELFNPDGTPKRHLGEKAPSGSNSKDTLMDKYLGRSK